MEQKQIICLVTLVIYIVGVIFFLCGFGGDHWLALDSRGFETNLGLWKQCVGSSCDDIKLGDTEGNV